MTPDDARRLEGDDCCACGHTRLFHTATATRPPETRECTCCDCLSFKLAEIGYGWLMNQPQITEEGEWLRFAEILGYPLDGIAGEYGIFAVHSHRELPEAIAIEVRDRVMDVIDALDAELKRVRSVAAEEIKRAEAHGMERAAQVCEARARTLLGFSIPSEANEIAGHEATNAAAAIRAAAKGAQ